MKVSTVSNPTRLGRWLPLLGWLAVAATATALQDGDFAYENNTLATNTVTFDLGTNGTHAGGGDLVQYIEEGGSAIEPAVLPDEEWLFTGWDADFGHIVSNMVIRAVYEPFSGVVGTVVFRSRNDHYYQAFVFTNGVTWVEAHADAVARGGYLATATSEAENNFIYSLIQYPDYWMYSSGPWLGGIQGAQSPTPEDNWQWITGESWIFANWYPGEPNDFGGGQNRIQFWRSSPMWDDDVPFTKPIAYVVEYQIHAAATGDLSVAIGGHTNVVAGYPLDLTGMLDGVATMLVWDFADGSYATNNHFPLHAWDVPGIYDMVLTAYNATYPGGISTTQDIHVLTLEDATVFVATDGDDANDGSSWATAKATIQAGVDATYDGGMVYVSNGAYAVTSEIAVDKAATIQSVNGAAATIVDGGGSNRCFNLGYSSCTLSGFIITNGYAAWVGGGIMCEDKTSIITNCIIVGNTSANVCGGVNMGTLYDCTVSQNTAYNHVGGLKYSTAYRCELTGNIAINSAGGALGSILHHCAVVGNQAKWGGGIGGGHSEIYHCEVFNNTALNAGGGIHNGVKAYDSRIHENTASNQGGGANNAVLYNCSISRNETGGRGGGAMNSDLFNCTLTGNSANQGGGIWQDVTPDKGGAFNCIVFGNSAADGVDIGWTDGTVKVVEYSCSPDLTHGDDGNITNAPQFTGEGNYRLAQNSPCINAGSNGYSSVVADIEGKPRIIDNTVDMGAYESFFVTDSYPSAAGFTLEWMTPATGWNSVVRYSTNLVAMPFADLSRTLAYPLNIFTDTVYGAESECFYRVEMVP